MFNMVMELAISIMFLTNKMNQRYILPVKDFVQILTEVSRIFLLHLSTQRPPSDFGRHTISQATFGRFLAFISPLSINNAFGTSLIQLLDNNVVHSECAKN